MTNVIEPALAKQRKAAQYIAEYDSLKSEVNAKSQKYAVAAYADWTNVLQTLEEKFNAMKTKEHQDQGQLKEIATAIEAKTNEIKEIKHKNHVRIKEKLA